MSAIVVVGTQWGDEGKGRVVDGLAREVDVVARFNGGDNAGHTVVAEGHTLKLHLIPSGVLYPGLTLLIGAGVVVNPATLVSEMDQVSSVGLDVGPARLKVSAAAHIILPRIEPSMGRARQPGAGVRSAPPSAESARRTPTRQPVSVCALVRWQSLSASPTAW